MPPDPNARNRYDLSEHEFEAMLARAAEEGAKRALQTSAWTATRQRSISVTCAPCSTVSGWCVAPRCKPPCA